MKRIFLSPNLTADMLDLATGEFALYPVESGLLTDEKIEEITSNEKIYTSIKNQALNGSLENMGLTVPEENKVLKFFLVAGDVMYMTQTSLSAEKQREISSEPVLPDSVNIKYTKFICVPKTDIILI